MEADAEASFCARCAELGQTCCQGTGVFLTRGDVERIRRASNRDDFYEYAPAEASEYEAAQTFDPAWSGIFDSNGHRRILRHGNGGDCCFLTPSGCGLTLNDRPLVCRLYPFEYNEIAIKGVHGHRCPAPERHNPPLLLALLAMNRERAEEWRTLLYREIAEEFPANPCVRTPEAP